MNILELWEANLQVFVLHGKRSERVEDNKAYNTGESGPPENKE